MTFEAVPVVLRVGCPSCGAAPGRSCPGAPPVCLARLAAAKPEFDAQHRTLLRRLDAADWADDEPTVPNT